MRKMAVIIIMILSVLSGTAYSASSELGNAVSALKLIAGFDVAVSEADADRNGKIELNDAICWLQGAAGFRVLYPDIVLLVATDTDKATLAWLPFSDASTSSDEMSYEAHLSKQENFEPSDTTRRNTVTGESQSDITGLEAGVTYYGMIVAVDKQGTRVKARDYRTLTTFSKSVIMSQTTPVSNAEILKLGTPQENGTTFTYTKTAESQIPAQGSVIAGYDAQGDMYLRKADSVSSTGTDIVVQTGDASLSDAMTQGAIYSKTKLFDVAQATEQRSAQRSGITASRSVRRDGTRYSQMAWKNKLLIAEQTDYAYSDDSLSLSPSERSGNYLIKMGKRDVSEEVTLNANVDFQPELITDASWSGLSVERAEIIARGTLGIDVQADYNFTASKEYSFEKDLFAKGWRSVYMIGTIPVYQRIALKVKASVTVKASSEIQANTRAAASTTIDVGVRYNNGTWEPVFSQDFSKSLTASMNAQGKVEAEIRLIPELEVKFYTVLAGSLFVEPYFTGTIGAEAIANADFLKGRYSFLAQLTRFDADMNVECFTEVKLTVLMKNIPILEKTKIGGPLDPPYQLFSLPEIALSGSGRVEAGKPIELTAVIKDGINNNFDFGTLKWDVFPDKGRVYVKKTETVNEGEYKVTAEYLACEQGDYTIFASGYGKLGEIARRFQQVFVNAPPGSGCAGIYVNDDAKGGGTGLTPEDAFVSLETALVKAKELSDANPEKTIQIIVSAGTYPLIKRGELPKNCLLLGENQKTVFITGTGIDSYGGTVSNCTFSGCSATGIYGLSGGGISNYEGGTVSNCTFTNCSATDGYGSGGIYNVSGTVSNCTFTNCSAGGGGGGGICNVSGTVNNCTFNNCSSTTSGGGIYNSGISNYGDGTVSNCTFNNCSAVGGGGISNNAGGMVSNCTFTNCSANGEYGGAGGGINNATGTVNNCTFNNCSATFEGGGINNYGGTVSNCTFTNCSAKYSGGGIYNSGTVSSCIFNDCSVEAFTGISVWCWFDGNNIEKRCYMEGNVIYNSGTIDVCVYPDCFDSRWDCCDYGEVVP